MTIDKANTNVELICTISELSQTAEPVYSFSLVSLFDNKDFLYPSTVLSTNTRYDLIGMSLDEETDSKVLDIGTYTYSITELSGGTVEVGLIQVIDSSLPAEKDEYITLPSNNTDDDYVVYNQ